jgi:tetratricopeptide (TPR) repeat protein
LRDYNRSLEAWDRFVVQNSEDASAWYYRGLAQNMTGRFSEATLSYEKAIRLSPENPQVWYNMGLSFVALNRLKEALECFERSLALDPDDTKAKYGIYLIQEYFSYMNSENSTKAEGPG